MNPRPLLCATMVSLALLGQAPAPGLAQGEGLARLTGEQRLLYEQAKKAYVAKEFQASVDLLSQALMLGEVDLFYFGLGRAYFKLGQCQNAQKSYARALAAPRTEADIRGSIAKGVAQLQVSCPGTLLLQCKEARTQVKIDGQPAPLACAQKTTELAPGPHTLEATLGTESQTLAFQIRPLQTTLADLTLSLPKTPTPSPALAIQPPPPAAAEAGPWRTIGLWSMPIGGALLLTALVLDGTLVAEAREEVELARFAAPDSVGVDRAWQAYTRRRNATLTAGALGVAVGIAGAVLFLGSDAPQETSSLGVTSWVGQGQAGLGWRWQLPN